MLIHRDGWRYSGRVPEFFTGQAGCFCCPLPPATYYYSRTGTLTNCCPSDALPDTLTVTITGARGGLGGSNCNSMIGRTAKITLRTNLACTPDSCGMSQKEWYGVDTTDGKLRFALACRVQTTCIFAFSISCNGTPGNCGGFISGLSLTCNPFLITIPHVAIGGTPTDCCTAPLFGIADLDVSITI